MMDDKNSVLNRDVSTKKKRKKRKRGNGTSLDTEKKQKRSHDGEEEAIDIPLKDNYPYEVVPDDHCETPLEAYQDISSLLILLSQSLSKTPQTLSIYDPYFCEGQMKTRLGSLGFENVYNEKEDFYQTIAEDKLPDFDILITNPPYSLDHMDRLLHFVTQQMNRPFCLLLPNYVYMKDYYAKYSTFPFTYITPANGRRYLYTTPKGRRQQKSSKFTSPFPTFWYCGRISQSILNQIKQMKPSHPITITRSIQTIPLEVAPDNDPRKKKLRNNLKRKKHKQRKKTDLT